MKFSDIKRYLSPHSIHRARITSINGAFAAAIVPLEIYDADRVLEALRFLGQPDPQGELVCVYCQVQNAKTWDHIVPVIKKKRPNGPGHQLGNLLPCCKDCNSAKGNKDWVDFLRCAEKDGVDRSPTIELITKYRARYVVQPEFEANDTEVNWLKLQIIQSNIEKLMLEADAIAAEFWASKA